MAFLNTSASVAAADNSADTIYSGGTIITIDDNAPRVDAVAVKDGRIIAAGSKADVMALQREHTALFDLQGRTMLPAFIDPHGHFPDPGFIELFRVDLASPPRGRWPSRPRSPARSSPGS